MPKRSYSMQRRVALEAETRECIVRATVALHARHGALATTYAMIAKRAQVATQTVYNHFPDDSALLGACTGHVLDRAPPLALEKIRSVRSPAARCSASAVLAAPAAAPVVPEAARAAAPVVKGAASTRR